MPTLTLTERQTSLQDQLRARRVALAEARVAVDTLRTQCAQLEGALALCAALLAAETDGAPPTPPELFTTEETAA